MCEKVEVSEGMREFPISSFSNLYPVFLIYIQFFLCLFYSLQFSDDDFSFNVNFRMNKEGSTCMQLCLFHSERHCKRVAKLERYHLSRCYCYT